MRHRFRLQGIALLLLFLFLHAAAPLRAYAPVPSAGTNVVTNGAFDTAQGWTLGAPAVFDPTVTYSGSTGSIKTSGSGTIFSSRIPVQPGKLYSFRAYMKTAAWPKMVAMFVEVFDQNGTSRGNRPGSRQATTKANEWQQTNFLYTAKDGDASIRLKIIPLTESAAGGDIWIDDVTLSEGFGTGPQPSAKTSFEGSASRIDALGNMELNVNGTWKPFFPLCIYVDNSRPDYALYSTQGFNCNMWGYTATDIAKAKNAVSSFNPDGLYVGMAISEFLIPTHEWYNNAALLDDRLSGIAQNGLTNRILFYYWDHENAYDQLQVPQALLSMLRQKDTDAAGHRQHPVYMLQGNEGLTRMFAGLIDMTGTYVTDHPYGLAVHHPRASRAGPRSGLL